MVEIVLFGLGATVFLGSLCGLTANVRIHALERRVIELERGAQVRPPAHVPLADGGAERLAPVASREHAVPGASVASREHAVPGASVASREPPPLVREHAPPFVRVALAGVDPTAAPRPAAPPAPSDDETEWWRRFELLAGTRWVTWAGAAALVVGAALFVKLAVDVGWLGPTARLALEGAGGVGLLLAGRRAHRADMRPLAQGLFGAGLGLLYVATYVGYASYGLIAREVVFASMIGVTITGCAIALRHDAQPVALLALIGGLVTPVAVSSGSGSFEALCWYLLVLDLGTVAIAMVRRWRALELVALAGTWLLFGGALEHYALHEGWPVALAWLAVFHTVFAIVPFAFHLRRRLAIDPGRFRVALVNAAVASGLATIVVEQQRHVLGVAALVMAATYYALGDVTRRRVAGDGRAHFGFISLAVVFATLSVPLLLRDHGITLAWSLEAPVLLALGFHYHHHATRLAGLGVLVLAAVHGPLLHWPVHDAALAPFANRGFASAAMVPIAAWLFALVHRGLRHRGDARDRWLGLIAAFGGGTLALLAVHAEVARYLGARGDALTPIVWGIGSMVALAVAHAMRQTRLAVLVPAGAFATIAAGLVFAAYLQPADPAALLALNPRFVGAVLVAFAVALLASASSHEQAAALWAAAIAGLGLAIGAEAYEYHDGPRAHTALSIAWAGYAAVLLVIGFARGRRALRLGGLGLLGAVAIKLVLVDLAGTGQVYRVLSFLIVGSLMIGVSYAYHRLERRERG